MHERRALGTGSGARIPFLRSLGLRGRRDQAADEVAASLEANDVITMSERGWARRPTPHARSLRSLAALGMVAYAGSCAQISRLGDYSTGGSPAKSDDSPPIERPEVGAGDARDPPRDEGPGEGDAGPTGNEQPVLGEGADDAESGDAREPIDPDGPSDARFVPDGYACGPGTCGGCCSAMGDCVGGKSVVTCGNGGQACADCTSLGACSQGSCAAPPFDAGPPPACDVASCSTDNCAGFPIQGACCKADQTCGCQWTIFAPCL
jgi:hypothetical protein